MCSQKSRKIKRLRITEKCFPGILLYNENFARDAKSETR